MALLFLLLPVTAQAQEVGVSPEQKFREASALSREGDYDRALAVIAEGLEGSPGHLSLLRLRGEVLFSKRDFEGALAAYEAFLEAGPRGADQRQARRIVGDLGSVRTTTLAITVTNGPARVYLDSRTLGLFCTAEPDCSKGMLPGRYRLFIERDGFVPAVELVTISLGKATSVEKTLAELPSALAITAEPTDAEIVIGEEVAGVGQATQEVPAGEHAIEVRLAGFAAHREVVTAREGKPIELSVSLAELVPLRLSVPGAEVLVDGEPATLVDGALAIPRDGRDRTVTARAEGFAEATTTIPGERERGLEVELTLERIDEPEPEPDPIVTPVAVEDRGRTRRMIAGGLAGAGVVGVATGLLIGAHARDHWNRSKSLLCVEGDASCVDENEYLVDQAFSAAGAANIVTGAGLALTAAAAGLWFTAPSPEGEVPGRFRRVAAAGLAGASVAGIAGGLVFGARAQSQWNEAKDYCDDDLFCADEGFSRISAAKSSARRANIVTGFGLAAGAAAAALWLTAPSAEGPPIQLTPSAGPGAVGLTIAGGF